jgi:hypothetical protein|tara:strand:- start:77 stop:262 length:186 start_codon:yes stop_codon:yes gene_type:complete
MNKKEKILIMELLYQEYWKKSEENNGNFCDEDPEYHDEISGLHEKLFSTTFKNDMYWGMLK